MAELKTKRTKTSVAPFLSAIPDPSRRKDARAVAALFRRVTGERPAMWGSGIVGYGHRELLARLGKHGKGKGCLHIRRLTDVDPAVLEELVRRAAGEARSGAVG